MFKNILLLFCLISIFQSSDVLAINSYEEGSCGLYYSPQLKNVMSTLQKLPEVRELMSAIQKEGAMRILTSEDNPVCQQFGACWDPDHRIIFVNTTSGYSEESQGTMIGSILFELQNAAVNSKINHYDALAANGQIEKEDYVRGIEYLEFQNSIRASQLAEKGIEWGIFPVSARLQTYDNFEEHYYFQKLSGHSAWIARNYHNLVSKT